MINRTFEFAVAAFVISLTTAVFSTLQWFTSESNARASTAIALSIKDMQDANIVQWRHDYGALIGDNRPNIAYASKAYFFYLNYVSRLLNTKEVDSAYVSETLKCQIFVDYESIYLNGKIKERRFSDALPAAEQVSDMADFHKAMLGRLKC
jgi:hypothetical protein